MQRRAVSSDRYLLQNRCECIRADSETDKRHLCNAHPIRIGECVYGVIDVSALISTKAMRPTCQNQFLSRRTQSIAVNAAKVETQEPSKIVLYVNVGTISVREDTMSSCLSSIIPFVTLMTIM